MHTIACVLYCVTGDVHLVPRMDHNIIFLQSKSKLIIRTHQQMY